MYEFYIYKIITNFSVEKIIYFHSIDSDTAIAIFSDFSNVAVGYKIKYVSTSFSESWTRLVFV